MKKLLAKKHDADTECDGCGERFPLWDGLEKKFASDALRRQVEELQDGDLAKLNARRKGKLLVWMSPRAWGCFGRFLRGAAGGAGGGVERKFARTRDIAMEADDLLTASLDGR